MKNIKIPVRTLLATDGTEAEAVNLRTYDSGKVEAVGGLDLISQLPDGDRLAGYDIREGRTYYFTERGGSLVVLGYVEKGVFNTVGTVVAALEGDFEGLLPSGDFVVVATSAGMTFLYYSDGAYTYLGGAPEFPTLAFGVAEEAELSADIAGRSLSEHYGTWAGTLQSADASYMERLVKNAVGVLRNQARENLMRIQPMVIRTALRLWDDSLLWSPDATVVGRYSALETTANAVMSAAGSFTIETTVLRQTAWKPSVTLLSSGIGSWRHLVKAVEIYATEEQETGDGAVAFRCESTQHGEPDYYLGIRVDDTAIASARGRLPALRDFRLIASISDIDEFMSGRIKANGVSPATDGAGGDMAASTYVIDYDAAGSLETFCSPFPAFSASVLTVVGDRCFAGNVRMRLPEVPKYGNMLAPSGIKKEAASVTVAVEIAGKSGTVVRARSILSDVWSETLNGMIVYPDRRAVRVTVVVVAGGYKYSLTLPMGSVAGCDMACTAISDGGYVLQPDSIGQVYADSGYAESKPFALVASSAGNPLQWSVCGKAGNRGVTALAPTLGLGSSWQLGRHSLCLLAVEGIYLLSFDTKGDCTGANLLSHRTVAGGSSVVPTSEGLVFADTSGEVCRLRGTKVVATDISVGNGNSPFVLGYSQRFDEVWVESEDGIIVVEAGNTFYRRKLPGIRLVRLQDKAVAVGNGGFFTLENESTDAVSDVELRTRAVETGYGMRLGKVVWNVVGDNADLQLSVYGENGRSCCGGLISRLHVAGTIGAPVCHRLVAPFVRTVRLGVIGKMMPGTLIESCCVGLSDS